MDKSTYLRELASDVQELLEANKYGYSKKHKLWADTLEKHLLVLADVLEKRK